MDAAQWHQRTQPIVIAERIQDTLNQRILLAEDNLVNRKWRAALSRRWLTQSTFVSNGADAVAAWEAGRYHLILMDCQMR